jgi:molybdopterin-guanine dinucleotide biosynthesis protein
VAVVGHCASGKTTLVGALRRAGYDAYAVAQEHSAISWLWKHSEPDALIYIQVSLDTVRARRGEEWPQAVYDAQEERLADARAHADLTLDSGAEGIHAMSARALAFLGDFHHTGTEGHKGH